MCLFVFLLAWIIIFFRIFCFVFSSFLLLRSFVRFVYCLFVVVVVVELFVLKLTQHLMISSQPLLLLVYFLGSILEDIELIIIKCIAPQQ